MKETAYIFTQTAAQEGGGMSMLLLFGGMFAIMYFLILRPGMRKNKLEKQYQSALKRGDWVVTTSGIHGKIFELGPDTVTLETGAGKIKFERNAISGELSKARYSAGAEKKE